MKISDLIEHLSKIKSDNGDLTICTYDDILEEYSENVLLEVVKDNYLNIFDDVEYDEILLL